MEEVDKSAISWLHGLQEYFVFQGDTKSGSYVDFLLKLLYANDPMITLTGNADVLEFVSQIRKFTENNIFFCFHKYYREGRDPQALQDAFSRGQVQSKIWLVNELHKIQPNYKNVLILAGWYGQILRYFKEIKFGNVRIVDQDREACLISDSIFNVTLIENYRVKAIAGDINNLNLDSCGKQKKTKGYVFDIENFKNPEQKIYSETFLPDLIINTSSEHMDDKWFTDIRYRKFENTPIVAIQSNNLFELEEHVNCVHSIDHMKKKYPMSEIYYEGELQLKGYKRVMLIGVPAWI